MKTRLILAGLFALLAAASGLLIWAMRAPYARFHGEVFVDIPYGAGSARIARQLETAGVVRHRWIFLAARALRPNRTLQAGEYRFAKPANVFEALDRLGRGDVFYYELAVPEGSNMFDIAAAIENLDLLPAAQFLKAARDPSLIRDLAPEAPSLEGYLFPAVYRLTRRTTPRELCRAMTDRFRQAWKSLGAPPDVHRVVTLASLVEKETAVASERAMVASVYRNRLEKGMKLDCDPTVIYAALIEGRFAGTILRSDLDSPHPYNTYRIAGLPPGPIANPGLASLKAALEPADSDFLYFVARADGSGAHRFSKDLEGHNRAVALYRRGETPKPENAVRGVPRSRMRRTPR